MSPPVSLFSDFQHLFREHFAAVCAAVQRFGVAERNAEDVTQDVFIAVFKAFDRYDARRPFKPWLKTIAYRISRDYLELRRTRERLTQTGQMESIGPAVHPEQNLHTRQAQRIFDELLQSLDAEHRTVFLLAEIDECTQSEIAQAIGVPESTVQSRLRRAREDFAIALQRRHVAEQKRPLRAVVPLATLSPSKLVEFGRWIPDISTEAKNRVWRGVASELPRTAGISGVGHLGFSPALALSVLTWSLTDHNPHLSVIEHSASLQLTAPVSVAASVAPLHLANSFADKSASAIPVEEQTITHGGMKLIRLAEVALVTGRTREGLFHLAQHKHIYPKEQAFLREKLVEAAMKQLKATQGADD